MHPELITLPGGLSIKTYGFCMMVGFLSAVWLAMRRAARVKASPDRVLDISFLCLLFGVGGARLFYVVHYWNPQFATAPNKLMAIVDIRGGGLEFLGGFLGAFVAVVAYTLWTRRSLRLYLDILAPSCVWGLAFGRLGCFFNGCCFGGICALGVSGGGANAEQTRHPWAIRFPFGSPAHVKHWENREVTVPAELLTTDRELVVPVPVPADQLSMSVEKRDGPRRDFRGAEAAYKDAQAQGASQEELAPLEETAKRLGTEAQTHERKILASRRAQQYPSRVAPTRRMSLTELQDLAAASASASVHPAQLYSSIQAMLLAGLLSAVFYRRKRHGVVIGLLLALYPIQRTILELIRADNPHDVGRLTASQGISIALFVCAVVYLVFLYRYLPERSPLAVVEPARDRR